MSYPFEYLLNAMEVAAQSVIPFASGYGGKRQAVIHHVEALTAQIATLKSQLDAANEESRLRYYELVRANQEIAALKRLVRSAKCPNCDGSGAIIRMHTVTTAECCGNYTKHGECCNDPMPVRHDEPYPEQCEWCAMQTALAAEPPAGMIHAPFPVLTDKEGNVLACVPIAEPPAGFSDGVKVRTLESMPETAATARVPAGTMGRVDLQQPAPEGKVAVIFSALELYDDDDDDDPGVTHYVPTSNLEMCEPPAGQERRDG